MNVRELQDNSGVVFSPKVSTESVYLKNSTTNLESKLNSMDTTISGKANSSSLATVATSGSYSDLSNKPFIPSNYSVGNGNLNSVITSGFYHVSNPSNSPGSWGQLIVCHASSDTITQIYGAYDTGKLYTRSGNPSDVGGNGSWRGWYQVALCDGVSNNPIYSTGFYVSSLRSLKENIEPTKVKAVDLINSQEIVDFNYKSDEDKQPKIGLIADDSDPLFLDKKGETVDLYNTCGILMKAVQELSARVKELESKIN